jgi:hypothetical protein
MNAYEVIDMVLEFLDEIYDAEEDLDKAVKALRDFIDMGLEVRPHVFEIYFFDQIASDLEEIWSLIPEEDQFDKEPEYEKVLNAVANVVLQRIPCLDYDEEGTDE